MAKKKTALITGGAVRLGREIALSLFAQGWNIVIHTHRSTKEAAGLADKLGGAQIAVCDLRNAKEVAGLIPALNKKGVMLDCLINNAAAFEKDTLATLSEESWRLHTEVNLFTPLQLMRDFAHQYKGKEGNIINITDGMTGWSVSPNFLSYSLSKLGLTHATQLLARELAPTIRMNAIAPGPTLEGSQDKKDTFAKLRKIIPLARTSSPQEVCDAIEYILLAPSLTGQIISLSGGMQLSPVF